MGHSHESIGVVAFENGLIPCFTKDTRSQTPSGLANIDHLEIEDCVDIADEGAWQTQWIARRSFDAHDLTDNPNLMPVRILVHSLGQQLPKRDLLMSRQHRMFMSSKIAERMLGVREVLVSAIKLTALPGVYVDRSVKHLSYIHMLLGEHNLVFVEGAQAETLYPGSVVQRSFSSKTRTEIQEIFPELPADFTCLSVRCISSGRHQR